MAICALPRANLEEPPEDYSGQYRGSLSLSLSLFSHAIRLRVKRGAPEHRDSGSLTGSPALTPWP